MLKNIAKKRTLFVMVSILFLSLYSVAVCFISNLNNQGKIVFVVVAWIVFIITFGVMALLHTIQIKRHVVSQKVWNVLLLVFVVFPGILSVYYFFDLLINSAAYMIVFPLNGMFSATICICSKTVKTEDGSVVPESNGDSD